ncbi:hypothetical protein NE237_029918 [Protea cynaroides]|uniref:DUF7880 domain-containing protein n=1 Tax=Protea cynaroides TaxID=273540 RepID=A0A9Q0JV99_9MAGN|nr:hypothetical protein NE237_029918 [Protea cynaroides]
MAMTPNQTLMLPAFWISPSREKTLESELPQYATCRSLLCSGPAASLLVNIQALWKGSLQLDGLLGPLISSIQYKQQFSSIYDSFKALAELDSLILHASRNDPEALPELMKERNGIALDALESLLQTIPLPVLDEGKSIADAYKIHEEDVGAVSLEEMEVIL